MAAASSCHACRFSSMGPRVTAHKASKGVGCTASGFSLPVLEPELPAVAVTADEPVCCPSLSIAACCVRCTRGLARPMCSQVQSSPPESESEASTGGGTSTAEAAAVATAARARIPRRRPALRPPRVPRPADPDSLCVRFPLPDAGPAAAAGPAADSPPAARPVLVRGRRAAVEVKKGEPAAAAAASGSAPHPARSGMGTARATPVDVTYPSAPESLMRRMRRRGRRHSSSRPGGSDTVADRAAMAHRAPRELDEGGATPL